MKELLAPSERISASVSGAESKFTFRLYSRRYSFSRAKGGSVTRSRGKLLPPMVSLYVGKRFSPKLDPNSLTNL